MKTGGGMNYYEEEYGMREKISDIAIVVTCVLLDSLRQVYSVITHLKDAFAPASKQVSH